MTRLIEPDDLFRLKFINGGMFSPDGRTIVYSVSYVNLEQEREYHHLWRVTVGTGEARPLTSGEHSSYGAQFSPDGRTLAFVSARNDKPQIYLLPTEGGEAAQLTHMEQGVGGGINWSPDGKQIVFTAGPKGEPRNPAKPYRVDRHAYRFDGLGYLDDSVQDIYVVSVESGETRQLTADRAMNSAPQWSPDGREILYTVSMLPDTHRTIFPGLRVINIETCEIRDLVLAWGSALAAVWMPDSRHVLFSGAPYLEGYPFSQKNDLWLIDAQGGMPVCRTQGLKTGVGGGFQTDMPVRAPFKIALTADGKAAYVNVQDGGETHIYRIALSGRESCEPVTTGQRTCILLDMRADGRQLAYIVSTMNAPYDLFVAGTGGKHERQLTRLNADVMAEFRLPTYEHLRFASPDGLEQEGWFMKPPTGQAPYPTVLFIHGGPYGAVGNVFYFDYQLLASAGIGVLFTNFRGSTGYGTAFASAMTGDWGRNGFPDHMAAVDHAIALGLADPDRLGVTGASHGGFATCWIVGHTERFRAAVAECPVVSWVSAYGTSDSSVWWVSQEMGGHPWEVPERYYTRSPLTYAHRCKTPTLLVHGEQDWRCPISESEQFYAVLKANGCPVEMVRHPNASHGGSIVGPIPARRSHNEALLGWMKRYLLDA